MIISLSSPGKQQYRATSIANKDEEKHCLVSVYAGRQNTCLYHQEVHPKLHIQSHVLNLGKDVKLIHFLGKPGEMSMKARLKARPSSNAYGSQDFLAEHHSEISCVLKGAFFPTSKFKRCVPGLDV